MNAPCSKCGGVGFLYRESLLDGGEYCDCALLRLRLANMDRIWRSLSKAKVPPPLLKNPPLLPYLGENLYITAQDPLFRAHFKAVALHQGTMWDARVRTDADLLDCWLGTTKLQGKHIYDIEIAEATSLKAVDLPSLLSNFPLMVIVLGVKRLNNRESSNALIEALNYRQHEELPVWLVDQPGHLVTENYHLFYSDHLVERLGEWPHVRLEGNRVVEETASAAQTRVERVLEDLTGSFELDKAPEMPRSVKPPPPPKQDEGVDLMDRLRFTPKKAKKKF